MTLRTIIAIKDYALVVGLLIFIAFAIHATSVDTSPSIPPCVAEDGPAPCYWDANERGNGQGEDFILAE